MLIILPPSETKAWGTEDSPLNIQELSFPGLNETREEIIRDLLSLCENMEEALSVLKLSSRMEAEVKANRVLFSAPTSPAFELYTGVLFDALQLPSLSPSARRQVCISSALFGITMAEDLIPHYRLSAGSKLNLMKRWRGQISAALNDAKPGLVLDLRSTAYQKLDDLSTYEGEHYAVKVVKKDSGTAISHTSKKHKGLLAREILEKGYESLDEILQVEGLELDGDQLIYKV
ncbi:MAG: peroxide stress protein YaaA [Corynebacterium sp.]|nr:peroxide stress protein YaaA [Corynebacterium sp.]